jgi:hypothetical protein
MIEIVENKVVRRSEVLVDVNSVELIEQNKSIDETIDNLQKAKAENLKDLEIVLELEKKINEKGNRKK